MDEMAKLDAVVRVESEMNGTVWWLSFRYDCGRGELLIYLEGSLVPDSSYLSLYVISSFPSTLFLYLSTTSFPLPLPLLRLYTVV